jgi:hypothetical protein
VPGARARSSRAQPSPSLRSVKPATVAFQHLNQRLGLGEATQMNQGFNGSGDE